MKKIIATALLLVLLVSLSACGRELKDADLGAEITYNGITALEKGKWKYFIYGGMPKTVKNALADSSVGRICRCSEDGSFVQEVSSHKAFTMHAFEDKIFFTAPGKNDVGLWRMLVSGAEEKKLCSFPAETHYAFGPTGAAIAEGGNVRFFDYATETEVSFTTGEVSAMMLDESYLYYSYTGRKNTCRLDLATGESEILCEQVADPFMYVDGKTLFFMCTRIPYRVDLATKEVTQISTNLYQYVLLNAKNESIVCIASKDEDAGLYVQPMYNTAGVKKDGENERLRVKIHEKTVIAVCCDDDGIYFVEDETGNVYRADYSGKQKTLLGSANSVYASVADISPIETVGNRLFLQAGEEVGRSYTAIKNQADSLQLIKEVIE